MGTNLISNEMRSGITSAMDDVGATFSREIYYSKKPEAVFISRNPEYIHGYQETALISGFVPETGMFSGRIAHVNRYFPRPFGFVEYDIKNEVYRGEVRLRVDPSGKALLRNVQTIIIDEDYYEVNSDVRPHGFFGIEWYDIFLKKSK